MKKMVRLTTVVFLACLVPVCIRTAQCASVCVVMSGETQEFRQAAEGLKKTLAKQNLALEMIIHILDREGRDKEIFRAVTDRGNVLYLVTLGSKAAALAARSNFGMPVVAGMVFSGSEIAAIANATGIYLDPPAEKQMALIRRIFPMTKRIGVVHSSENENKIAEAKRVCGKYGLMVQAEEVGAPKDILQAFESAAKTTEMLWGLTDAVVLTPGTARQILLFSLRNEVPFFGPSENWAKAGAVAALTWDFEDLGVQCAELLIKLHKGAKAQDLPPQGPRKVEFALNLRTAEHLKIEFSPETLKEARHVFKGE